MYKNIHSRDKLYLQSFHPPESYSCRILMIFGFSEQGSQYQSSAGFRIPNIKQLRTPGDRMLFDIEGKLNQNFTTALKTGSAFFLIEL